MLRLAVILAVCAPLLGCGGQDSKLASHDACSLAEWQQGKNYVPGDKVIFQGGVYVAEHENPGYSPVISTWFWEPSSCEPVQNPEQNPGQHPVPGGSGLRGILTEAMFNQMFPARIPFYNYAGLVNAVDAYPGFAKEGNPDVQKREVAAFLANIDHESGQLRYIEEINQANWPHYCDPNNSVSPCAPGKQYYGRGPIQISWNYNYAAAGRVIGVDLLANPELVARDPKIAWQTAIWFWMTQKGAGTMPPHEAVVKGAAFGETIRAINGALECGGRNAAQVKSRVDNYARFTRTLGVSPGNGGGC